MRTGGWWLHLHKVTPPPCLLVLGHSWPFQGSLGMSLEGQGQARVPVSSVKGQVRALGEYGCSLAAFLYSSGNINRRKNLYDESKRQKKKRKNKNLFLAVWVRHLHFHFALSPESYGSCWQSLHPILFGQGKRCTIWQQPPPKTVMHDSEFFLFISTPLILLMSLMCLWGPRDVELLLTMYFGSGISHL